MLLLEFRKVRVVYSYGTSSRKLAVQRKPRKDFPVLIEVTLSCGSADTPDLAAAAFFCLVCLVFSVMTRLCAEHVYVISIE